MGGGDGQNSVHPWTDPKHNRQNMGEEKDGEMEAEVRGRGTQPVKVVACTYHDDSTWLLCSAHAHDGSHANGGALEIHPAGAKK